MVVFVFHGPSFTPPSSSVVTVRDVAVPPADAARLSSPSPRGRKILVEPISRHLKAECYGALICYLQPYCFQLLFPGLGKLHSSHAHGSGLWH